MIYRVLIALLLVAVVAVTVVFGPRHERRDAPEVVPAPRGELVYSARDAEIVETGPDGLPMYTLRVARIRQLAGEHSAELEDVRMEYRDAGGNVWTLSADRGRILDEAARIELAGDVRVDGVLPGTREPAHIATESLSFDTQAQIATTQEPVTFLWSGHRLEARGLVANLKEQRVQLESEVHGIFSP